MSGRVVDDGDLVTGGGVTSGLDVALYLLERELGADVALGVEKLFEYERRGTVWRSASLNGQRPDTEAVSQLHEISVNKPASTLDAGDERLANRFIGVWKVELATPIGALQITLDISSLQGILHGRATQGDQTVSFHDISLHGDCLQWTQRVTKPMRLTLRFSVTVEADVMTGTAGRPSAGIEVNWQQDNRGSRMMPLSKVDAEILQVRRMRVASLVEGATLVLLLGVAVPLKHLAGMPTATTLLGPIHGLAFIFYFWTLVGSISGYGWSRSERVFMVLAALIPFGAFACERRLAKREATLASQR